jgi:hypothetical protein
VRARLDRRYQRGVSNRGGIHLEIVACEGRLRIGSGGELNGAKLEPIAKPREEGAAPKREE